VLLSFLKVRIVVNNKDIYPLLSNKPVIIPVEENYPKIVATDGFHFTKPLELVYQEPSYYKFRVDCAIDDLQLLGGSFLLVMLYLLGFFTGIFLIKLLSFAPIVWFLFLYYINRRDFIRIRPIRS
jgi:hypothetical protein